MKSKKAELKYKIGDLVRSTFRKAWIGRIEGYYWVSYKGYQYPIYYVKPILDVSRRPQPKSVKTRALSQSWLEPFNDQQ